uniref:ATP synthase F0 subunit 8 n=1 Tax=Mesargus serrata TaxID=2901391 RepID=A0A8K2AU11_9HEMI|nr:ATP synthase F0 subunit 8 [Mesargus serrata]
MPQMAPMWWLMLMFTFNLTLIITLSKIYFFYNIKTKINKNLTIKMMNWW